MSFDNLSNLLDWGELVRRAVKYINLSFPQPPGHVKFVQINPPAPPRYVQYMQMSPQSFQDTYNAFLGACELAAGPAARGRSPLHDVSNARCATCLTVR